MMGHIEKLQSRSSQSRWCGPGGPHTLLKRQDALPLWGAFESGMLPTLDIPSETVARRMLKGNVAIKVGPVLILFFCIF